MITGKQLREAFLGPGMKFYFDRKLALLANEEITARIEELLKYLNIAVHCNGDIPVSREIYDVWHYWILETAEYERLCRKMYSGGFLHHSSRDYAAYADPDAKNRRVDLTFGVSILSSYVLNYGPFVPDRVKYWPLAVQLMEHLSWNLDQLNDWLSSVLPSAERELQVAPVPITAPAPKLDFATFRG